MDRGAFSPAALTGNVAHVYDETAAARAGALALESNGDEYSHADLAKRSARVAGGLRDLGLSRGDRFATYVYNRPELVVATLAAFKAGLVVTPMNPQFTPREVAYQLADSGAGAVLSEQPLLDDLRAALDAADCDPRVLLTDGEERGDSVPLAALDGDPIVVDRADGDVAMQPYTSGTTGRPKGVLLTHRNLRAQSLLGFDRTDLDADEERFLSVLPLAHVAGFVNRTWQPLVRGAAVYLRDPTNWDPGAAMATIERERITKFGAVTAMYVDIVNHDDFGDYDLSSLREVMEGGDRIPAAIEERFKSVAGVDLFEAYGLTETGGGTHVGFGSTFGPRTGTIGQPLRATDCKVVDEDGQEVPTSEPGELLVRGPHVMAGYHDRPEETDAAFTDDGYFRTGDVVRRDADNYYRVVDRKNDLIVTAGYTVYPREVEDVLHEHPAVVDAAVVGVPDDRRTATVEAFVVTDAPAGETELKEHCLDRLAAYKHPRRVRFVEHLPRTHNGKVRRTELRKSAD